MADRRAREADDAGHEALVLGAVLLHRFVNQEEIQAAEDGGGGDQDYEQDQQRMGTAAAWGDDFGHG